MDRKYIEEAIAGIAAQLKGPMPNLERALLVADRKDFRARLAELDAAADADREMLGSDADYFDLGEIGNK